MTEKQCILNDCEMTEDESSERRWELIGNCYKNAEHFSKHEKNKIGCKKFISGCDKDGKNYYLQYGDSYKEIFFKFLNEGIIDQEKYETYLMGKDNSEIEEDEWVKIIESFSPISVAICVY